MPLSGIAEFIHTYLKWFNLNTLQLLRLAQNTEQFTDLQTHKKLMTIPLSLGQTHRGSKTATAITRPTD